MTSDAVACATEQNVLGEGALRDARRDELLWVDRYQVIRECQGELIRWTRWFALRVLEGIDSRSEFGGRTR